MSNDDPRARILELRRAPGASDGPGDPTLSPLAATLLAGIRAGRSWLQLAADLGLMPGEVYTELLPLVAAHQVVFSDGEFRPAL